VGCAVVGICVHRWLRLASLGDSELECPLLQGFIVHEVGLSPAKARISDC